MGFLEKNRDHLGSNLFDVMSNSESQFVADLFSSPVSETGALQNKWVYVRWSKIEEFPPRIIDSIS